MIEYLENFDVTRPDVLVGVLSFVAVMFLGIAVLFFFKQRRKGLHRQLQTTKSDTDPSTTAGKPSRMMSIIEKVGNVISHGNASASLWEQLIQAGHLSKAAPAVYTGVKIVLFLLGLVVAASLTIPGEYSMLKKFSLISVGGGIMFFVPNLAIILQKKKRQEEVQQNLPDVVDLLEVSVTSGVGLDMAWNLVADEIDDVSPVLGTAMDMSNFEMHLGASRAEALRNMAVRTGAIQLSSLAAILVQSERFGTSMAVALREFASSMREERRMRAEENAEKIAVKLIGPMVLFIFPAMTIVMVGPAIVNIAQFFLGL
ncbi:type II secretion system F family protein [Planctomycetota bacterium]